MTDRSDRIVRRTEEVVAEESIGKWNQEERTRRIASALLYELSDMMLDASEEGEEWPDWSQVHQLAAEVEGLHPDPLP